MKRKLLLALAISVQPCFAASVDSPARSIVYIEGKRAPNSDHTNVEVRRGTGFIIADGHLLTAAHVIFEDSPDHVESYVVAFGSRNNHSYPVSVVKVDRDLDIALLSLPENIDVETRPLKRGNSSVVQNGERLQAYGFPSSLDLTIADGILSSKRVPPRSNWQTTIGLNRGQSGGPVFNSDGEWVAIAVAGNEEFNSITYAVPERYADGLISIAANQEPSEAPSLPIRTIDFRYASAGSANGSVASATQRACLPAGYTVAAAVSRTGSGQIDAKAVDGSANCIDITSAGELNNFRVEDLEIIGAKDVRKTEAIKRAVADELAETKGLIHIKL